MNRCKPRTANKILEGAAMFLSGPSPSFAKLEVLLGKQAIKGIRDNVRHYKRLVRIHFRDNVLFYKACYAKKMIILDKNAYNMQMQIKLMH